MIDARHKCPIQEELKRSRDRRKTQVQVFLQAD
jgi:hypothetical protein